MARLEDLKPQQAVSGILPDGLATIIAVMPRGSDAIEITYKAATGQTGQIIKYRWDEGHLEIVQRGKPWSFDGDGALFRLVSEAQRIKLAHLFDPVLAVHTSSVTPYPHQITAVYECMLPRQPLRFLLADDPGAGKTIMAGLLIKELMIRGDVQRCMVVCPGNLGEQWQDELSQKFGLPFEILTNDNLEASRTGNWFQEHNLVIARLDKLSRDEKVQTMLSSPDCRWDLIICDEAHKMAATYFGSEVKYTKRYQLGKLLSGLTRHFLLMSATPHNGKEVDFQLFMGLLDRDRFEGAIRAPDSSGDVSDLMRRMVKEKLLEFDGTPLFPERIAYTVPYKLSPAEDELYKAVTEYVREEFNRADRLNNDKRAATIGFALTILQRRLASSPEAIFQSLRRRRERLEERMTQIEALQRKGLEGVLPPSVIQSDVGPNLLDLDDADDIDESTDQELTRTEEEILGRATAASSIVELKAEIETLKGLQAQALAVSRSGNDTKWRELAGLLDGLFSVPSDSQGVASPEKPFGAGPIQLPTPSPHQKVVIFTEHRDTLGYLNRQISILFGRPDSIKIIHGGMGRSERRDAEGAFKNNPNVRILLATDAAGEGINLQRAHLMVNYDLPWNPNRIEQRFGRIHRIGQKEVCHLWNLVAQETREGDVYLRLLEKLEQAREALGGQVFDVLGKLQFGDKPLRDLLIEAIRYGDKPEVRARLTRVVESALDRDHLEQLLEDNALARDVMDVTRVNSIRQDMERADARRLQPHFIESFFLDAFKRLGGSLVQKESRRFQISNVPALVQTQARTRNFITPVVPKYERVTFDKDLVTLKDHVPATFIFPGHPLLDTVLDLTLERNRDLLKAGAILVDETDRGKTPRVLFYLEHAIQDATPVSNGSFRVISKRMSYVEIDADGNTSHVQYAPYLDFRPLGPDDPTVADILARPECQWVDANLESTVMDYAVSKVVPDHFTEIRSARLTLIEKTRAAVQQRLSSEIIYWDGRAATLREQEKQGKVNARLNSSEARKRADDLQARLNQRHAELRLEENIMPLPPVVLGGFLVIPAGLLADMTTPSATLATAPVDTQASAARARAIIMAQERALGFDPVDREFERLGYDIESRIPNSGRLRFIEVKGRVSGAQTITVTRNEILFSLNKVEDFILAIVEFMEDGTHKVHYIYRPFRREPDFDACSVNYDFAELIARAEPAR